MGCCIKSSSLFTLSPLNHFILLKLPVLINHPSSSHGGNHIFIGNHIFLGLSSLSAPSHQGGLQDRNLLGFDLSGSSRPDRAKKKPCLSFPSGLAKGKQSSGISALKRVLYRSGEGNPTAQATSRVSLISSYFINLNLINYGAPQIQITLKLELCCLRFLFANREWRMGIFHGLGLQRDGSSCWLLKSCLLQGCISLEGKEFRILKSM